MEQMIDLCQDLQEIEEGNESNYSMDYSENARSKRQANLNELSEDSVSISAS